MTDTIDYKIAEIKATVKRTKNSLSEKQINKFLDLFCAVRDSANDLKVKLSSLNDDLYSDDFYNSKEFYEENISKLIAIKSSLVKFCIDVKKSEMYSGLKTSFHELFSEVDILKEIISDLELKYSPYPEKERITTLLNKIKSLS